MAEEKKSAKINAAEQAKLKNKIEHSNQEDNIKEASPEKLRHMLSNKNSDYIFRLQKELEKQGNLSTDQAKAKVDKLLVEIIIAQRHNQTANVLFSASPKLKAENILHPVIKPKTIYDLPFWQRAVDSALLWLAIFMAMYGLLGLFNTKNTNQQNGILTITTVAILLGIFMAKYNEWLIPNGKGKPKIIWSRVLLTSIALIVGLFVLIFFLNLPFIRIINPVLPGIVYIIIAAIAYCGRYLFRKKYKITGSAFVSSANK